MLRPPSAATTALVDRGRWRLAHAGHGARHAHARRPGVGENLHSKIGSTEELWILPLFRPSCDPSHSKRVRARGVARRRSAGSCSAATAWACSVAQLDAQEFEEAGANTERQRAPRPLPNKRNPSASLTWRRTARREATSFAPSRARLRRSELADRAPLGPHSVCAFVFPNLPRRPRAKEHKKRRPRSFPRGRAFFAVWLG